MIEINGNIISPMVFYVIFVAVISTSEMFVGNFSLLQIEQENNSTNVFSAMHMVMRNAIWVVPTKAYLFVHNASFYALK